MCKNNYTILSFEALIVSQVLVAIIDFVLDTWFTKKQIGLTWLNQLKALRGVFGAALIMAVVVYITTAYISNEIWKLIVGFVSGIIFYFLISYIFDIMAFRNIVIAGFNNIRRS